MLPLRRVEEMTAMYSPSRIVVISILLLNLAILVFAPLRATEPTEKQAKLNGGYYLLHQLGDDESKLPLLLVVKHAPPEIHSFADLVSKTGKETVADIESFQDKNQAIQFDRNPLPKIEQEVRDSIKDDKQHQLLFGTTDSEFARALLVSQIEASSYGLNLGKVLAAQETDPDRIKTLQHLSKKWLTVRENAFRLLRNY